MHALYAIARELIFTAVTMKELKSKGIDFLTPAPLVLVEAMFRKPPAGKIWMLRTAVTSLFEQLSRAKEALRLDIAQCKSLPVLQDFNTADIKVDEDGKNIRHFRKKVPNRIGNWYWRMCIFCGSSREGWCSGNKLRGGVLNY